MLATNRIAELIPELPAALATASSSSGRTRARNRDSTAASGAEVPHDHLVKLIAPPADARFHDRLFRRFRRQLIERFQPADELQLLDIDLIAADALHLASLRQAMELMTAPLVPQKTSDDARRAPAAKRRLKLLQRLVKSAEAGRPFDCTDKEAEMVAPLLAQQFEHVQQCVAEADAEDAAISAEMAAGGDDGPVPITDVDAENQHFRQLLEILLPIAPALKDVQQAKAVLTGGRELSPEEQIRWTAALKLALENNGMYGLRAAVETFSAAERAKLLELAKDPVRLAVLHRVAAQLEEAIEKRVRRLKPLSIRPNRQIVNGNRGAGKRRGMAASRL